jgi:hypothetical protein
VKTKTFTSENGWFSMTLPDNWSEYEDEEGTYAFFNTKEWTGNFRITPFRTEKANTSQEETRTSFIENTLKENDGAVRIKLGDLECAHYKTDIEQDNKKMVMYYWTMWQKNTLFSCSFVIDKKQEHTAINKSELQVVQDMIKSIKVNF